MVDDWLAPIPIHTQRNICHGSDSVESAENEIKLWCVPCTGVIDRHAAGFTNGPILTEPSDPTAHAFFTLFTYLWEQVRQGRARGVEEPQPRLDLRVDPTHTH